MFAVERGFRAPLLLGTLATASACSLALDLDGYRVGSLDGGVAGAGAQEPLDAGVPPPVEVMVASAFHNYRFARGPESFAVAADAGLLSGSIQESGMSVALAAGSFATSRGGGVELGADGSFTYTPAGAAGAFWGDDSLEYRFAGVAAARHARLTVYPERLRLAELGASGGAGFGVGGGRSLDGIGGEQRTFAAAGDVNGDGLEDFAIGYRGPLSATLGSFGVSEGRGAYILFGKRDSAKVSLGAPPAGAGFFVVGDGDSNTLDSLGSGISGAGDVNGDGFDDVIVGSLSQGLVFDPPSGSANGAAYVVFGKADTADVSSTALLAAQGGGFVILGSSDDLLVGYDVAGAGDVNGDGLSDVIIGVPFLTQTPDRSAVFVAFGKVDSAPVRLADLALGVGGFALIADGPELWGVRVAGLGDVNADGLDDIGLGSAYPDQVSAVGRIRVVFGKRDPPPTISLADLDADPSLGFSIDGVDPQDQAIEAAAAGDVDGDGIDDILISAPTATLEPAGTTPALLPDAGAADAGVGPPAGPGAQKGVVYVVFGRKGGADSIQLSDVERGSPAGFAISGPAQNARAGYSISAGDLDSDGRSDVTVSTGPTTAGGGAFVVFGSSDRTSVDLSNAPPERVLAIEGPPSEVACGLTVSGSDFNGDGLDDLLLSSRLYPDAPQAAGGAYVAFSWDMRGALHGRDQALIGGAADDVFDLPETPVVVIRGGHGTDTLRAGSATPLVNLRQPGRYQSIELVDVRGGGPQRVLLDDAALRRLPQNHQGFSYSLARSLAILGDAEDTLEFDMTGFRARGGNAGRVVYGKDGVYYGLEVSSGMTITAPAAAPQ